MSKIVFGAAGNKGYTFATWLRLERMVFDPTTAGQSIFCFLSRVQGTAKGMAAALQGLSPQLLGCAPSGPNLQAAPERQRNLYMLRQFAILSWRM